MSYCHECGNEIDIFNEPYVSRTCKDSPQYCDLFHSSCAPPESNMGFTPEDIIVFKFLYEDGYIPDTKDSLRYIDFWKDFPSYLIEEHNRQV